jgi:carbon monoxide dehydrogenase subunit G
MDLTMELILPSAPDRVWAALTDFRRAAACVPGCEDIEELSPLARYRGVMRQRVGPFKLEAPVDIVVEEVHPPASIRAKATGRDSLTGTVIKAGVTLSLAPAGDNATRLAMAFAINVSGRLATLGFPIIRQRTQESVTEFGARLRATLVGDGSSP